MSRPENLRRRHRRRLEFPASTNRPCLRFARPLIAGTRKPERAAERASAGDEAVVGEQLAHVVHARVRVRQDQVRRLERVLGQRRAQRPDAGPAGRASAGRKAASSSSLDGRLQRRCRARSARRRPTSSTRNWPSPRIRTIIEPSPGLRLLLLQAGAGRLADRRARPARAPALDLLRGASRPPSSPLIRSSSRVDVAGSRPSGRARPGCRRGWAAERVVERTGGHQLVDRARPGPASARSCPRPAGSPCRRRPSPRRCRRTASLILVCASAAV